jgi:hypothetical protein
MNQPTTYALGLFHGGLIIGFVWIMFKSIGKTKGSTPWDSYCHRHQDDLQTAAQPPIRGI